MDNKEQISLMIRSAIERLRDCQETLAQHDKNRLHFLQSVYGNAIDEMLKDSETAIRGLNNKIPEVRLVAVVAIKEFWRVPAITVAKQRLEIMCHFESHPLIRANAVYCICQLYASTNDRRIGHFLAKMVLDSTIPIEVRKVAYVGLYEITGKPVESWPGFIEDFNFPIDVDWKFVESF